MAVHLLEVSKQAVPDLRVPRMHPCEAKGLPPSGEQCGATPASLWERTCQHGHRREVRLCGSHAAGMTCGGLGACQECVDKRITPLAAAVLRPVDLLLLGHAGRPA